MTSKIIAAGKYVPPYVASNDQLEQWMDTSDEWIRSRTGIQSRRLAVNENTSDLCIKASKIALEKAGIAPEELGFIIVATMTPDYQSPSVACLVQDGIGAVNAYAFDLNAACSGFVFAFSTAEKLLSGSGAKYGLVVGGETMSKAVDWNDRSTAVLFGDGAGAVILEKTSAKSGIVGEKLHSDGTRSAALTSAFSPVNNPVNKEEDSTNKSALSMDGKSIFDFAVRNVPANLKETALSAELLLEEIDLFLLHQANERILKIIAKKLALPIEKFASNIAQHGNTSAASIPMLLNDCLEDGSLRLGSGQRIMLCGFGGGLTWGSIIYEL